MSNGEIEAIQFDDNLNTGLFLSYDMKNVAPLMPQNSMSVEVWFTIDAGAEVDNREHTALEPQTLQDLRDFPVRRALVGVEAFIDINNVAGNYFCSQGWSLSYSQQVSKTTLRFHLGLEGTDKGDKALEFQVAPRIVQGVWQHLVATYDGTKYSNLYLNGVEVAVKTACKVAPCGAIVYPGLVAVDDTVGKNKRICKMRPYNFSIGSWKNGEDELKDFANFELPDANSEYLSMGKHHGAIHMVRVYEIALTSSEVRDQYDMLKYKMGNNSLTNPVGRGRSKRRKARTHPPLTLRIQPRPNW